MAPKLRHTKARTGCERCKARKVKCDEEKPRCGACTRHNVTCEYVLAQPRRAARSARTSPSSDPRAYLPCGTPTGVNDASVDSRLELRLMHIWTAYTCRSFSTAWQFWCYQAPLIAFEYRFVLDALLALASLHASRQSSTPMIAIDGRVIPVRHPLFDPSGINMDLTDHAQLKDYEKSLAQAIARNERQPFLPTKRSVEWLAVSRMYFDRAIDGYRKALADITEENIEAIYACSILVSFNALFTLSESEGDTTLPTLDPLQWLRLAQGTRYICQKWAEYVGTAWIEMSGVFYGKPDMHDDEELFHISHAKPFGRLLTFTEEDEEIPDDDRRAYRQSVSYIGLTWKGIFEGCDTRMMSCRRLIALPSKCPPRLVELIEEEDPRAKTILAHVFATMKLIVDDAPWFKGIAERQVPKIHDSLPQPWREMTAWPMAVANGELDREPKETEIDDILLL